MCLSHDSLEVNSLTDRVSPTSGSSCVFRARETADSVDISHSN